MAAYTPHSPVVHPSWLFNPTFYDQFIGAHPHLRRELELQLRMANVGRDGSAEVMKHMIFGSVLASLHGGLPMTDPYLQRILPIIHGYCGDLLSRYGRTGVTPDEWITPRS